jgi:hypothetical protein
VIGMSLSSLAVVLNSLRIKGVAAPGAIAQPASASSTLTPVPA